MPDPVNYFAVRLDGFKKAGSHRHKALCPFHGERTASFMIENATGKWKCFGCGQGGSSVLSFHMDRYGLDFVTAAKELGAWR